MRIAMMTAAWMLPCPMIQVPIILYFFCRVFAGAFRFADARF